MFFINKFCNLTDIILVLYQISPNFVYHHICQRMHKFNVLSAKPVITGGTESLTAATKPSMYCKYFYSAILNEHIGWKTEICYYTKYL